MANRYPNVQGFQPSFVEVECTLSSLKIQGLKEVKWTQSLEASDAYGAGPHKLGRTVGQFKPEGSMTVYTPQWRDIVAELATRAPNGWALAAFDLTINFRAYDDAPLRTVVLEGCRITKVEESYSGTDPAAMSLTLNLMNIKADGVYMIVARTP